jgi:hypothetical protein
MTKDTDGTIEVRDRRKAKRFVIDNAIIDIYGPLVGPYGLAIYMALCRHANGNTQQAFPRIKTLVAETGMSERKAHDVIQHLCQVGLIRHESGKAEGARNVYHILEVHDDPEKQKAYALTYGYLPNDEQEGYAPGAEGCAPRTEGYAPDAEGYAPHAEGYAPRTEASEQTYLTNTPDNLTQDSAGDGAGAAPDHPPPKSKPKRSPKQQARDAMSNALLWVVFRLTPDPVGTATADIKTQIATTPTIAAQWTESALLQQATVTADARTAQALEVFRQATVTADARTAEALAAYADDTATANALTFEARAAIVHGTVTAIAALAETDALNATGTPVAMTATAEAVQSRQARYQGLEDLKRLFETIVLLALAGVAVAAAVLAVAIAAKALWRLANGPRLVRRRPGEPMPVLLTDERRPVTVHDPARQPAATATTAQPGLPVGIPPALQAEVTRLAQQGDIARALLLFMAGQSHVNGKQVSREALPAGVSVEMLERLVSGGVVSDAPRVIVLEMFDRGRLVGEGIAPQQVEVIDGEWVYVD